MLAGLLTAYAFDVLSLLGKSFPAHTMFWMLTGTPYYPVQIGLALSLGWLIGRRVQHRAMVWVWVLPLGYLTYALIAIPTLVPRFIPPMYQAGIGESRFKHYFGWGCGASHPCFDQNAITVVFYIAAAYSIGAFLARRLWVPVRRNRRREFWMASMLAVVFGFVAIRESVLVLKQVWNVAYLPLVATPIAISAFLALYAVMLNRGTTSFKRA